MSKRLVESCLTIAPHRGALRDAKGTWNWRHSECVVHYSINSRYSELRLDFEHGGMLMRQGIELVYTTPYYGGFRWWFLCPKCNQRVSTLHKPHEIYGFFCRRCHNLTYESLQSSGTKTERFLQKTAQTLGSTTREARQWVRLRYSAASVIHEVKRPIINKTRDRRSGFALSLTRDARSKGFSI